MPTERPRHQPHKIRSKLMATGHEPTANKSRKGIFNNHPQQVSNRERQVLARSERFELPTLKFEV